MKKYVIRTQWHSSISAKCIDVEIFTDSKGQKIWFLVEVCFLIVYLSSFLGPASGCRDLSAKIHIYGQDRKSVEEAASKLNELYIQDEVNFPDLKTVQRLDASDVSQFLYHLKCFSFIFSIHPYFILASAWEFGFLCPVVTRVCSNPCFRTFLLLLV